MSESSDRRIDVNSINMFVTNKGSFANDFANNNNSGLFFPKGTIKTAVYESGIWIGGKVHGAPQDDIRVAIAEYSQEFQPGTMTGPTSWADPALPQFTTYKVKRWTGTPSDTAHVERDAASVGRDRTLDPLEHHSWSEYMSGAVPYGAPWKLYDLPDPAHPGAFVSVPGPDVKGDQMLWSVYNDGDPEVHVNRSGRSAPMGVEVQQSTFAFDRQGALGNTVFLDYKVINKSANSYDSCYVIVWSDPDLGGAGDDLVGCDTTLSVGYVYNATNTDQLYGDRPPCVGYDYFKGPEVNGTPLGMSAFIFYINGTDPQNATQTYNYMRGTSADGSPFINPLTDQPEKMMFSGDPVAGTGWLDSNPSDRRFMCIAGPFTLAAGDTQQIVAAVIVAQGGDRLSSVTGMKFFDIKAQKAFDIDFQLPPPPPQPQVSFSTDHGSINLLWDSGSRFNYIPAPGYEFEGYNVYQGASVSGPWKRLRTYDVVNGIGVVRDSVFDISTGQVIHDMPVSFGGDNGVQYTFGATEDAIRGGSLKDGTTYYYVISALNAGGESANSSQASVTPQVSAPSAPTGLAATAGNQQAALTWNASCRSTRRRPARAWQWSPSCRTWPAVKCFRRYVPRRVVPHEHPAGDIDRPRGAHGFHGPRSSALAAHHALAQRARGAGAGDERLAHLQRRTVFRLPLSQGHHPGRMAGRRRAVAFRRHVAARLWDCRRHHCLAGRPTVVWLDPSAAAAA